MSDEQGIPAAPSDRDLPDHRRIREELLMKIGPETDRATLRHRWGVPLGVAAGVTAVSTAAVVILGGTGEANPKVADRALSDGGTTSAAAAAEPGAGGGSTSSGAGSTPSSAQPSADPDAFSITDPATTPIEAGSVAKILSSCLGPGASRYHAVVAVRTPIASKSADGVVVAVDSAHQYVQCQTKGDKGSSLDSPPTFINNRLWGTGEVIEYFDSTFEPAGKGKYLTLGAGHYSSNVTKITVSYGGHSTEYPVFMAGGAFVYAAAVSPDKPPVKHYSGPIPYVHAYNASGKEIYDQTKDPKFTSKQ
ncbi:hypothetical protein [Streptomyces sp. NPDC007074]|uniref:hypothetical protein n=1 Tax=Streptomyces sp. NPDC007074 TaxID=3156764 RepID=UPI0033CD7E07